MVAGCWSPSSVTATVSPTGACEPSASVPETVTLEVPYVMLWLLIPEKEIGVSVEFWVW